MGNRQFLALAISTVLISGGCSAASIDSAETTSSPPSTAAATTTTSVPPTTRPAPSTTTSSVPVVDSEAVAFAEALIADLNAADIDAVNARFPEHVKIDSVVVTMLAPDRWSAYGVAMESIWELGECKPLAGAATRCVWLRTSEHEPYFPEARSVAFKFRLESGLLAFAEFSLPNDSSVGPESDFTAWMFENHPAEASLLYFKNGDAGYYEQRVVDPLGEAELKKEFVPLWRASLNE